nr:carboxymuconolactone decarboxylase family protein [Fodinicola feengrottensis]
MDPRFNLFDNELAAKFGKRFANTSMVIGQSPLPKSTQALVSLRASQINGCGFCTDMHTKDARRPPARPRSGSTWSPPGGRPLCSPTPSGPRWRSQRRALGSRMPTSACPTRPGRRYASTTTMTETAALLCLVALINAANRLNVMVRTPAGSYQPGMFDTLVS